VWCENLPCDWLKHNEHSRHILGVHGNTITAVIFVGGQTLLTRSLQLEKAGVVALVRTLDIALAFILQLLFLDYAANIYSIAGAALVLGCNALVILNRGGCLPNKEAPESNGELPEEKQSLMGTVKRQYGRMLAKSN